MISRREVPAISRNGSHATSRVRRVGTHCSTLGRCSRKSAARESGSVVWGSRIVARSEEHTSELQSLMRTSYAVFCLTKKISIATKTHYITNRSSSQPTKMQINSHTKCTHSKPTHSSHQ